MSKRKEYWNHFTTKIWPDPVWSKVISAAILTIIGFLFVTLNSVISKISFTAALSLLWIYLSQVSPVNNGLFIFLLLFATYGFYKYVSSFGLTASLGISTDEDTKEIKKEELPHIPLVANAFFETRVAGAFPGDSGIVWYNNPKIAVQRLAILLKEPLTFQSNHSDFSPVPIWWLRGQSSLNISRFKILSKTKVLMNEHELEIKRIAVCKHQAYWKHFVYIEVYGETQTGLYELQSEDFQRHIETFGYSWEEYALLNGKPIKLKEYNDGAAVIKGKVVPAVGSELRTRYLSHYNFIITSQDSPYNSQKFEIESERFFNGILNFEIKPDDFFEYLLTYPKRQY
jgi:hypothetical protein